MTINNHSELLVTIYNNSQHLYKNHEQLAKAIIVTMFVTIFRWSKSPNAARCLWQVACQNIQYSMTWQSGFP